MTTSAERTFDDWARRGRDEGMERGHFPRAEQALQRLPLAHGQRVLDLGCGNGWASRWMRARVGESGRAAGIDVSREMLGRARRAAAGVPGLDFLRGLLERLPFRPAVFDHAFSMEALYYARDIGEALSEAFRVVRPGGSLMICTDFYRENPHSHAWPEQLGVPMQLLSEQEWREALAHAGFDESGSFRCLDPRPVDDSVPEAEREAVREFRQSIGTLAVWARRR